ncbi:hypothetical protein K492DRAFT_77101 [Lichtheimia hyalospora FSU 10163]|nr:hypothetical protein K492DRAFT_77101 [Lichtheimia hyalospora FSU 10163]
MSSLSLLPLFRRHHSDNEANHDVPDATEMTQIVDIDRILALTDARHTLRSFSNSNSDNSDNDDDDSSISSIHNMQATDKEYYDPSTNGGRRPYFDDEFDESRQRLVSDNDIEHGDRDEDDDNHSIVSLERGKRKGNEKWICAVFLAIILVGGIMWGLSFAQMGKGKVS